MEKDVNEAKVSVFTKKWLDQEEQESSILFGKVQCPGDSQFRKAFIIAKQTNKK